jgi:glycosyltransferase involved in cell wall biosynthesis
VTAHAPLVSVLMTAFNRERYIAAAIQSVLVQTFDDFELVIVDDGSRDQTVTIAREYARTDARIRVSVNERNLGDYRNRNHAASLARGRFLKYHDSDDIMYPHCLAAMAPALLAEPRAGFALSTAGFWPGGACPMLLTPRMCYQREFLGSGMFNGGPASALFRREMFEALGGFGAFGAASDYIFWIEACASYAVLLVPGNLFWYRQHPGQELQSAAAARDYARTPQHAWRALSSPNCPLDSRERELARRNLAFITARTIWRHVKRSEWSLATLCFRSSGMTPREWFRYLRRQKRSWLTGTPVGTDGEFLDPEWLSRPAAHHHDVISR